MKNRYIYLGGPISGLTYAQAHFWRSPESTFCKMLVNDGWEPLSPMRGKEEFRMDGVLAADFDGGGEAVKRDLADIRKSECVLFNFVSESDKPSIGSLIELGFAYAERKPIIVVTEDRQYDHVFLHFMVRAIVPSIRAAIDEIELIKTGLDYKASQFARLLKEAHPEAVAYE